MCFCTFNTETESKTVNEEIMETKETERGMDVKHGKISICLYEKIIEMYLMLSINIFLQTGWILNPIQPLARSYILNNSKMADLIKFSSNYFIQRANVKVYTSEHTHLYKAHRIDWHNKQLEC